MKKIHTIALLLFCTVLSSCSANRLLTSWNDSSFEEPSIAPILLIGIARDETKRRIYEDTFADSLTLLNTKSVASYKVSKQSIEPTENALREVVQKTGAKTVLITHMVSESEKEFYQPASIIHGTNSYSTGGLYRYYPFMYNSVFTSGSYSGTTKVILESNLYDVKTEKLIWTARSESIDPVMTRKYYQQLIDLFLDDLSSKNLL
jgi:hypothetical protein